MPIVVVFPLNAHATSLLTGVPPFELALPSQDQRCHVVAVEEKLGHLVSIWKMPLSAEVSRIDDKKHCCCLMYSQGCRQLGFEVLFTCLVRKRRLSNHQQHPSPFA